MENVFRDIQKAQEAGACYSALALALTIPDVCGEYENIEYIAWYNKWMPESKNNEFFNGAHCYALRCAFLHSLNADIEKQKSAYRKTGDVGKELTFKLIIDNPNEISVSLLLDDPETNEKILYIQANALISAFLIGLRKFINANPDARAGSESIIYEH